MKILVLALVFCSYVQASWSCFVVEGGCPNKNVTFWLYTNATRDNPTQIRPMRIDPALFQPPHPVYILIHGYTGHRDFSPNTEIRPELLDKKAVYVISVDFGPLVRHPCFKEAILNALLISECLGQLINNLVNPGIINKDDLHLIGFSLGAQVAGQTANYVNHTLHHITGLDPAKPLFVVTHDRHRLNREDAKFVDIIHTNPAERGILKPMGHADFYVNFRDGEQPGCENHKSPGSCSHNRAPEYYAESIASENGFWGIKCNNWHPHAFGRCTLQQTQALMGYPASPNNSGTYFLETYANPPFAAGHKGAIITDLTTKLFDKTGVQHIDELEQKLERRYLQIEADALKKSQKLAEA
ncbi:pancreatic triacylglycerol lipase-like isoform X1 [Drosophila nasuta]|uniref:pancreatic triacylglycerol lipase-like isoform X1 n=2 Tax=Drosophila nasuta TaxID=42062 RepID=UPI00295E3511|nr:pancreatic triacylglycerol lipase-like isoform X1 [Drosophila nasuta]